MNLRAASEAGVLRRRAAVESYADADSVAEWARSAATPCLITN
jgi:hypothetical protein